MSNLNVQLAGAALQVIDNVASIQRVNSPITTLVGQVAASYYDAYYAVANPGPTSLTLPATIIWLVYIRNISSTNTISITATPTGGSPWTSPLVIPPNSIYATLATYASNPSAGGITALSIGTNGASTFAEILLAA